MEQTLIWALVLAPLFGLRWAIRKAAQQYGYRELDLWVMPMAIVLIAGVGAVASGTVSAGVLTILGFAVVWLVVDRLAGRRPRAPAEPAPPPDRATVLGIAAMMLLAALVAGGVALLWMAAGFPPRFAAAVALSTVLLTGLVALSSIRRGRRGWRI